MTKREIADAIVAELRRLGPGEQGNAADLKAAIGCKAAELQAAIDLLRFTGKLGFYGLVLSASMRDNPAEPPGEASSPAGLPKDETAGTREAGFEIPAPAQTTASMELATVPAPGGGEAQPARPVVRQGAEAGGDKRSLPPPTLAERPTGAELAAEVRTYCERTGTPTSRFGVAVSNSPGLLPNLELANAPRADTVARIRAFIAAHPGGVGPPAPAPLPASECHYMRPSCADAARGEAEALAGRRQAARRLGGTGEPLSGAAPPRSPDRAPSPGSRESTTFGGGPTRPGARSRIPPIAGMRLDLVETVQTLMAEAPKDLITAITRKHPALWRRAIALGRAAGVSPAAALYDALEAGLTSKELAHGDA